MVNLEVSNGYKIKTIEDNSLKEIERLIFECSDYYKLCADAPPSKDDALEIFTALPPGKQYEDKYSLGVFNTSNRLIGVVDIVKNYPATGEWMLGLLLIKPNERSNGLGRTIHAGLVEWARTNGAASIRIGVIEDNIKAEKFWFELGYVKIKTAVFEKKMKKSTVNVMRLDICSIETEAT